MNPLEQFLGRITAFLQKAAVGKQPILTAIKNVASISLTEKDVDLRSGVVYITASSSIKNEIFMRKNLILNELKKDAGNQVRDIR